MRKVTITDWRASKHDWHTFISKRIYPDNYPYTRYDSLPEPVEIDEELYYYFRECLPPFEIPRGFQNSEDVAGGTYDTFTKKGNRYFYHGHGPMGAEWLKEENKA